MPSDFSSASSSPLSISSKNPHPRFDTASFLHSNFYELAAVAAAHAAAQAAAYHNTNTPTALAANNRGTGTQISVNEASEQGSSIASATNPYPTFQDFANALATQTAV